MPAVSEAQRRYLYAKFGAAWVKRHHFNNDGKLPAHKHRVLRQVLKGRA
jgi:hypothetical protein